MPRLLLVDDNPSIHKIAETLLAPTDIQIVCVDGAKEALSLVAQGERFDVALVDIVMPDTDGWQLLDQLRMHPATAGMPIAMMAGVLDTVDPSKLEQASIQGFLKKPVELKDLGERVRGFLAVPVKPMPVPALTPPPVPEPSPFATFPAVRLSDLPEYRKPGGEDAPFETPAEAPVDADILVLTEADLWVETPGTGTEDLSIFAEIPPEESLDLEDLDLEGLKGLEALPPPIPTAVEEAPIPAVETITTPALERVEIPVVEAIATPTLGHVEAPAAPAPSLDDFVAPSPDLLWTEILPEEGATQELPDLGPDTEPTFDAEALAGLDSLSDEALETRLPAALATPAALAPDPDFLAGLGEASVTPGVTMVDWSDESEALLGTLTPSRPLPPFEFDEELDLGGTIEAAPMAAVPELSAPEAAPEPLHPAPMPESPVPEPLALAAAPLALAPAPLEWVPATPALAPAPQTLASASLAGSGSAAEELVRAIASDPALVDVLAKALVARLSDQVLREIAWEVMPEVAERLQRH